MAGKHSMEQHNFIEQEVSTGGLPEEAAMDAWQFMHWRFADHLQVRRAWIAEHQGYMVSGLTGLQALEYPGPRHSWCNATCHEECAKDHDRFNASALTHEWRSAPDLGDPWGPEEYLVRLDQVKVRCIGVTEYQRMVLGIEV